MLGAPRGMRRRRQCDDPAGALAGFDCSGIRVPQSDPDRNTSRREAAPAVEARLVCGLLHIVWSGYRR